MGSRDSYEASVRSALARIAAHVPEDIVAQFAEKSGITKDDLHPISPGTPGLVSAVDGSNAMVLEGGSLAIAAIRAARTTFHGAARAGRATTPLVLVTIGPRRHNQDFEDLFLECFGVPPHKGLDNSDPVRASDILRDTLEYWVATKAAETMPAGSLLLLDGALRVSSQNHEPVLSDIVKKAGERGLLLAAVAKRTKATWGNGHPLLPALMGLAEKSGVRGTWWTKIDPHLLDNTEYRQGRHGEIYVASLHPRMTRLMKIELPRGISEDTAAKTMQALAACADDGRIPGYPYPLFDAHRAVVIDEAIITQVLQDIKGGLARQGIQNRLFEDLFGDLHGDFERY
ncbi:DNA double-strand break repair nuclease NurA [Methanoregula sp.]|uniref:DNA double-strand break repair nuclease NurA n=1 Tax=Methanoregula sp. TaxID=2052170 RepID=UPI002CEF8CF1|nr:DNA double-strand break repair nuclease NurA [Methanoregula sp.]HVP97463.1 DNA double-strand break repair nuclease NurA [Methanoregula sp.]